MTTIHFANTNFELELASIKNIPEILTQLYFLPLLYAKERDGIVVDGMPKNFECNTFIFKDMNEKDYSGFDKVESWGYSLNVAKWAKERGLKYEMPPFDVVKNVNSKAYSFIHSPQLEGAKLLFNLNEAYEWLKVMPGKKVFKTCFGLSGRGHFLIENDVLNEKQLNLFLNREFSAKRPVIAEPWKERLFDFSTQWYLHKDTSIEYIGPTLLENSSFGSYMGTVAGCLNIPHLEEHKEVALSLLEGVAKLGYFGFVGLDAMVIKGDILHPIVEMNARRTLGLCILQYQQKYFPNQQISLRFERFSEGKKPLLPSEVYKNDHKITFMRNLYPLSSISEI